MKAVGQRGHQHQVPVHRQKDQHGQHVQKARHHHGGAAGHGVEEARERQAHLQADVFARRLRQHPRAGDAQRGEHRQQLGQERQRGFVDLRDGLEQADDQADDQRHQQHRRADIISISMAWRP
jgi:hypothetical protein